MQERAVETAAPWKPWKNELHVFPPFPLRLENSAKHNYSEFSTVPTAPTAISILRNAEKLRQQQRYLNLGGHYDQQSVKTIQSQTTTSMAGFEVDHVWPLLKSPLRRFDLERNQALRQDAHKGCGEGLSQSA